MVKHKYTNTTFIDAASEKPNRCSKNEYKTETKKMCVSYFFTAFWTLRNSFMKLPSSIIIIHLFSIHDQNLTSLLSPWQETKETSDGTYLLVQYKPIWYLNKCCLLKLTMPLLSLMLIDCKYTRLMVHFLLVIVMVSLS